MKTDFHTLAYNPGNFRILFRDIIQGIEGKMDWFFVLFHHPRQDFQLTECAKLYVITKYFPAVQGQYRSVFLRPGIRNITTEKFICTSLRELYIFIYRA